MTPSAGGDSGNGGSGTDGTVDVDDGQTPKTDGPGTDEPTDIEDGQVPKTDGIADQWSVVNLILMVLAVILGAGTMAGLFRRKREGKLIGLIPAVVALAAFLLTEDMTQPITAVDRWTPLMAVILAAAAATAFVPNNKKRTE